MNISQCKKWIEDHDEFLLDLVRIYLGAGLVFKAISFMPADRQQDLIKMVQGAGGLGVSPATLVYGVIGAHLLGGLLLAVGLLTRWAALVQIPVLLGVVFYVDLPQMKNPVAAIDARQHVEFSALVLFLMVLFFVRGAGPYSLDHRLFPKPAKKTHDHLAYALIRIYLGLGLFLKAVFFMSPDNQRMLMKQMEDLGSFWFAPAAALHYVIPVHLLGGILLAIGLLTRVAAGLQIPILLGVIFYLYLPQVTIAPRQNLEFSGLVLFLLAVFFVRGSGHYSVDNYLSRSHSKSVEESGAYA